MSSQRVNGGDDSSSKPKSVRFASSVTTQQPPADRKRNDNDVDDHVVRRKKRPRMERPNEDEADDVDDWEGDEDTQEGLPSTHDLLEAKRKRRERGHGYDSDDDDTRIDARTSLLAEIKDEVTVEPFNMDAEQTDGSGYFDGDTYVFRKRNVDEEPDAWLESLGEGKEVAVSVTQPKEEDDTATAAMDDWSREELYAKMIPLVSDTETVLQALARYGDVLKRQAKQEESTKMAQGALNDLTEAANALLLKGDVDVYQKTRNDLLKLLPETKPAANKQVVTWEYRGNQDGQIHGPYTTAEMLSWTKAGYFVGAQAVQIRPIHKVVEEKKKSAVDDLLSDLMEDDDDDDDDKGEEKVTETKEVRGDWRSSNDVDFSSYA